MKKDIVFTLVLVVFLLSYGYYNAEKQRLVKVEIFEPRVEINIQENKTQPPCTNITDSSQKDMCYFNRAQLIYDVNLCDNLVESTIKIRCYTVLANITKDPSPCVKILLDYQRDLCYKTTAISKKDVVLCGGILFKQLRKECYDSISIHSEWDRFKICSQIQITENKAECYDIFEARQ